ncbi:MAG: acetoin dehydrogenase dihydrolipoyllysine-residue acetyltransferase subunit [Pseudomonadota bacterium]
MTTLDKITLPMPRLGETMDEGTIANWIVQPGDSFARGDALLELETDKTLVEYPALGSGKMLKTLVGPGDIVTVGAPIAVIETDDVWDGIGDNSEAEPAEEPEATAPPSPTIGKPASAAEKSQSGKVRATPLARRLARQNGIALATISGTGRRNRIEARDVEAAFRASAKPTTPAMGGRLSAASTNTLFLVHGFAGARSNWTALRGHFERDGRKTAAPDLPGHGRNTQDATDIDGLVSWLTEELREQSAPVHLVGHSLGAHLCARAAQMVPDAVSALTLIAPAGCGHDINGGFIDGIANATTAGEVAHLMRLLGPKASSLDSDALASMAEDLAEGRLKGLAAAMARGDKQQIDTLAPLQKIAQIIPTQAIFGAGDAIVPKDHVFNMPPHVAIHMVRSGHMPHWDCPGLLHTLLAAHG